MQGRHPRESEAMIAELMMPQHANIMGNVFGGVLLAMVDRVAAVAAIRHARRPCVTVSVDKVDFREPIRVGELVTAMARVNFTGHTSMEGGVKVIAESLSPKDVASLDVLALVKGIFASSILKAVALKRTIRRLVSAARFADLEVPLTVTTTDVDSGELVLFGQLGADAALQDVLYA